MPQKEPSRLFWDVVIV